MLNTDEEKLILSIVPEDAFQTVSIMCSYYRHNRMGLAVKISARFRILIHKNKNIERHTAHTIVSWLKGAVSYRFSQGLLTLICNNSKLKADINFFVFLLRRQTSKVYNWLQKFMIQHPVALL